MKKFFLLLIFFTFSLSQDFEFSGKVIDKETKNPIVDANMIFIDVDFGVASDLEGNFFISNLINQKYEILISAIGYKNISIQITIPLKLK